MRKLLGWIAAGAIAISVSAVVARIQAPRYRCNILKARHQVASASNWANAGSYEAVQQARGRIADLERCLALSPSDVDMHMVLALNYRVVGRLDDAAAVYRRALRYDRRPEIFLNLGLVELEASRHDQALRDLAQAVAFDPRYANHFHGDALRDRVLAEAQKMRDDAARR